MIFAIKHEGTMAYVEAGNPVEALALVNNALEVEWTKENITMDKLLPGTVILTETKRNQN